MQKSTERPTTRPPPPPQDPENQPCDWPPVKIGGVASDKPRPPRSSGGAHAQCVLARAHVWGRSAARSAAMGAERGPGTAPPTVKEAWDCAPGTDGSFPRGASRRDCHALGEGRVPCAFRRRLLWCVFFRLWFVCGLVCFVVLEIVGCNSVFF